MSFRKLNDVDLNSLSDEKLIDYIRHARKGGERAAMTVAIQVFAYRHRDNVLGRIRTKLRGRPESDIEATTDLIIGGAMFAAFEGDSVGEFKSLLNTVFKRRVADYFRRTHGHIGYRPLADEVEGEEGVHGAVVPAPEEISGVWGADLRESALERLSAPHRAVVEQRLFAGYTSEETVDRVNSYFGAELKTPMTVPNVDKIVSRFRKTFNDLLNDASEDNG